MSKEISKMAVERLSRDLFPAIKFEGMPGDNPSPQKTKDFVAKLAKNGTSLSSIESALRKAGFHGGDEKYKARKRIMKALESIGGGEETTEKGRELNNEKVREYNPSSGNESKKGLFERFFKL